MRLFIITALLLAFSTVFGAPQDKTKSTGEYDVRRCGPRVVRGRGGKSPEFQFRKGETYRNSPVVKFEILESGEIAHPVLKRSSGVAEVDNYAMKSVQELKFNKRPGCGVIESNMDITIDFRS
jgi:TonB family protein